jgi:hypothetical protein
MGILYKMKEETKEWMPVVGYEWLYEVSSDGDVKNVKRQKLLRPNKGKAGYLTVVLQKGGLVKSFRIHRIVAIAFIKNPEAKKEVNHINGNKEDNNICNLEWATRRENSQHAWDTGLNEGLREVTSKRMSIMNAKQVVDLQTGIFYDSLKEACKATNSNYGSSEMQIRRKSKTQRFNFI